MKNHGYMDKFITDHGGSWIKYEKSNAGNYSQQSPLGPD